MAKTVEVDLQVNTNLEPTIKNLRELKKQLRETAAGSKEFDKLSASIRDMEDSISDAKATNDDFLGQLENASGPLGTLGQGIRGAERTFSSFNGALKASVIGIIVGLVAGLAAAFSNNEKAQKKLQPVLQAFEKILGGVFAIVEPLFDTFIDLATKALPYVSDAFKVVYSSVTAVFQSIGKLGSAVGKLISGDFSGAWKDAKESVTGFSKNFDSAKNRYDKGSKEMTTLEKENAAKRAEALEKENERKKAAADKAAAEAEKRRQAEKEAEEKRLQERKDYISKQQEIEDEVQGAKDALILKQEEDKQKRFLSDIERNAAAQKKITDDAKAQEDARTLIAKLNYEERIAYAQAASNTLSQLSELAGKETAAGKALGIASATINTYVGVSEALKQKSTLPSPFDVVAKVANVATVLATGFKAIKAITSVKVPAGGGGGGAPTPISVSGGAVAAAPSFNVVGTSGQNQIAQSLGNQAPVKAYVVSNDVTTAQSLDRNIVNTATIGN
jgi:small basic protein